jgi:arylsulfatase A-like enzyme
MTVPSRWLALLALAVGIAGCSEPQPTRAPDVLLIVIDTLRADHVGALRDGRPLTPFLDELAKRGTSFDRAYSTSSWTMPAVASLFTSRSQEAHGVSTIRSQLALGEWTLAEQLGEAGYVRIAFLANQLLGRRESFGQGFSSWNFYPGKQFDPDGRPLVRADFLRERVMEGIDAQPDGRAPLFVYAHFMEPHLPYDPPTRFRKRFGLDKMGDAEVDALNRQLMRQADSDMSEEDLARLRSLYAAEIAFMDEELRGLFDALEKRGRLREGIVIVTSDHGEEFREHARMLHGSSLYEEAVRVPLLMIGPGIPKGRRIAAPVSLLDLAPSILELAGLEPTSRFEGESLASLFTTPTASDRRAVLLELASKQERIDIRAHARGVVESSIKLVVTPAGEIRLYDLEQDPHETDALDPSDSQMGARLLSLLEQNGAADHERASTSQPVDLSPEERADLRALGYVTD